MEVAYKPEDVDSMDDILFPSYKHHNQIKSDLQKLVDAGVITDEEAGEVYSNRDEYVV